MTTTAPDNPLSHALAGRKGWTRDGDDWTYDGTATCRRKITVKVLPSSNVSPFRVTISRQTLEFASAIGVALFLDRRGA